MCTGTSCSMTDGQGGGFARNTRTVSVQHRGKVGIMSFSRTFGRVSPCARGRRVQRPSPTSRNRAVVDAGRIREGDRHVEQGDAPVRFKALFGHPVRPFSGPDLVKAGRSRAWGRILGSPRPATVAPSMALVDVLDRGPLDVDAWSMAMAMENKVRRRTLRPLGVVRIVGTLPRATRFQLGGSSPRRTQRCGACMEIRYHPRFARDLKRIRDRALGRRVEQIMKS